MDKKNNLIPLIPKLELRGEFGFNSTFDYHHLHFYLHTILITLGGTLGNLYKHDEIDIIFWISSFLFFGFLLSGFVVIHKIKRKTDELEDL